MRRVKNSGKIERKKIKKKTSIGNSIFTKRCNKGGGERGSTTSKNYKKKYRGQGR